MTKKTRSTRLLAYLLRRLLRSEVKLVMRTRTGTATKEWESLAGCLHMIVCITVWISTWSKYALSQVNSIISKGWYANIWLHMYLITGWESWSRVASSQVHHQFPDVHTAVTRTAAYCLIHCRYRGRQSPILVNPYATSPESPLADTDNNLPWHRTERIPEPDATDPRFP